MNVGELEDLLALLPADMPVIVCSFGGARHVVQVSRKPATNASRLEVLDVVCQLPDGRVPPVLILRGDHGPLWWEAWADDVPYEVDGRWPAKPRRRP